MTYLTVKANRVHGPGKGRFEEIIFGEERLHASGVFANVYIAKLRYPKLLTVAIKKTWPPAGTSLINPEVYFLSRMRHPSVVSLLYHFTVAANNEVCHCMVFDYLPTDLNKLRMHQPGRRFDILDAKLYGFQIFAAIDYVNSLGVAHRDVKPSNIIVDGERGILKLADFGNAKLLRSYDTNTSYQVTRYYRAPELIFGSTNYTTSIDLWACACVLAELASGKVLLQGRTREDQGRLVIDIFGYPTKEQCAAMKVKCPRYARKIGRGLSAAFEGFDIPTELFDLLKGILRYEPKLRTTGAVILTHPFFKELRSHPPPQRSNGNIIPPFDYDIIEQLTQSDGGDESEESSETE